MSGPTQDFRTITPEEMDRALARARRERALMMAAVMGRSAAAPGLLVAALLRTGRGARGPVNGPVGTGGIAGR
ncbi:MAG: hypothetical protein ACK4QW_13685 [Alphaproteobacteria bacterium]